MTLPILEEQIKPLEEAGFGSLETANGNLPLKALDVRTRIAGLLAHTTVQQTFKNTLNEPLEATYIFPLPDRAAVTSFVMEVSNRRIEGVLEEREKAREEYEKAIEAGHRAAIAEEERPNVFTLRVGNLMPGEEAQVTLTLAGPLQVDEGEVTYRFPLVVAPRYIPGIPLDEEPVGEGMAHDTDEVPDASRITPPVLLPGFPNPVRLSLEVEIESCGLPIQNLRSSLHAVATEQADGFYRVRLNLGERLDRDFILRYTVAGEEVHSGAMMAPDAKNVEEGTLMLLLTAPKADTSTLTPRDVVLVLDRSGSMSGWKIVAARRALGRLLDTLTPQDRFAVLAFDNVVETLDDASVPSFREAADRERYRTIEWLSRIEARGGTEMRPALQCALKALHQARAEALRCIVLVTDGQIGNEEAILRQMVQAGIAVFTVGVDMAPNDAFLRRLSEATGGFCELVESEDRLDEVMERVRERLGAPVLREIRLEVQGVEPVPDTQLPDGRLYLYSGGTMQILGRWKGKPDGAEMRLSATLPDGEPWHRTLAPQMKPHPALRPVWARGMIRALEDRYFVAPSQALEQEIVKTSLRYGVLSRFTAYVAIDRSEVVNEGGQVRRIVQPVEAPEGWAMFEAMPAAAAVPPPAAPLFSSSAQPFFLEHPAPRELSAPGYVGGVQLATPKKTLAELDRLDRSDALAMQRFLRELFFRIEGWIDLLRRKGEAPDLMAELERLHAEIMGHAGSTPSLKEVGRLLDRCRPVLEELVRRGLPSKRRRWW